MNYPGQCYNGNPRSEYKPLWGLLKLVHFLAVGRNEQAKGVHDEKTMIIRI